MSLSFQCPCGSQLSVQPEQLGTAFDCPSCGRELQLPALGRLERNGPRPHPGAVQPPPRQAAKPPFPSSSANLGTRRQWRRLGPVLAVVLVILAGLGLLLSRCTSPPPEADSSPSVVVGKPAPEAAVSKQFASPIPSSAEVTKGAESPEKGPKALATPPPGASSVPLAVQDPLRPLPPLPPIVPPKAAGPQARDKVLHFREGDRFYQEVVVSRLSACQAPGLDFRDQAGFSFLSNLRVDTVTADGLVVTQKVEAIRLDQAGTGPQAGLGNLLKKAKGAAFRITLAPDGEVVRLEGAPDGVGAWSGLASPEGLTLSLQPSLDADAWKELAQLTFFRPRSSLGEGGRWSRDLAHDWGPLGHWAGQVSYKPAGKAAGLDRYDYVLNLAYQTAAGNGGDLPFTVSKADFQLVAGRGSIAYDASRGRVAAAEERFQVRGLVTATALGVTTPIEMEEVQVFRLRVLDQMPEPGSWMASHP